MLERDAVIPTLLLLRPAPFLRESSSREAPIPQEKRGRKWLKVLTVPGLPGRCWGWVCGRASGLPRHLIRSCLFWPRVRGGGSQGRELTVAEQPLGAPGIHSGGQGEAEPLSSPPQHHPAARLQGQATKLHKERVSSASCKGALF